MVAIDNGGIGARIRAGRGGVLTQQQLADRAGVSVEIIRGLEQGKRETALVRTLAKIARALDLDLAELIGKRTSIASATPNAGVIAIRRALTPVDDLVDLGADGATEAELDALTRDPAAALAELGRDITYGWGLYWAGHYEQLSVLVPELLPHARAVRRAVPADLQPRAADALARALWATGSLLVHLGQTDIAWQAINQALDAANHGDDPLLAATVRGSVAWQLLVQGRYGESRDVCVTAARNIEPSGRQAAATPQHLSTFGSLLLTAGTAAARDEAVADALHLVDEAAEVAARIGHTRHDYETYFGPAQVIMQRCDVGVVTEDYVAALTTARRMPRATGLPVAARCRHLADQALAHTRLDHPDQALDALLAAESAGQSWIAHQSLPRQITAELMATTARPLRLRELATRLGVAR